MNVRFNCVNAWSYDFALQINLLATTKKPLKHPPFVSVKNIISLSGSKL